VTFYCVIFAGHLFKVSGNVGRFFSFLTDKHRPDAPVSFY